jgi:FkbM family methyltransferase
MKTIIKKLLRRAGLVPIRSVTCLLSHAYSQEGEDMVLGRIFERKSDGFYVDVGAHHPIRYSNTYFFYRRGWRGINIDAMPGSMEAFKLNRPKDINLEIAVAEKPGKLAYHIFNDPALNTFDKALARERDGKDIYKIVEVKEIEMRPLAQILADHLPAQQSIDFLSVDVEGLDLAVLRSNDWSRFSPEYVLAEDFSGDTVEEALASPIAAFLRPLGYVLFAKTAHTQIYKRK